MLPWLKPRLIASYVSRKMQPLQEGVEGGSQMNIIAKSLLLISLGVTVAHAQIPNFQHIVVIVQENRTPDNLFQGLCKTLRNGRSSCSTTPNASHYNIQTSDWLDKNSPDGTTQPEPVPLANNYDLSHAHSAFVKMCNADPTTGACKMDGAGYIACFGPCPPKPQFKFVDNSTATVTPYLQLATQYGWAN
jgi:hypothetical protein